MVYDRKGYDDQNGSADPQAPQTQSSVDMLPYQDLTSRRNIRNLEKNSPTRGTGSSQDASANGKGGNTRQELQGEENKNGFYRPESSLGGRVAGTAKSLGEAEAKHFVKSHLKHARNIWAIGVLSTILGGGVVILLLSYLSGPLQFMHTSRSLDEFHMSAQKAQTGIVALKLARNLYYVGQGERQKTRLGTVGNYFANGIVDDMESRGFTSDFRSGAFKGYIVDPKKIDKADYVGMRDNSPEEVRKYFSERFNIDVTLDGDDSVRIPRTHKYFTDVRILYGTLRTAKINPILPVKAHIVKQRLNYTLNPMSQWIRDKDNQILENAENRYKEWRKQQRTYVRNGITQPAPRFSSATDQDGNPTNQDGTSEADRLRDEANEIRASDDPDASRLNEFRNSLRAKLGLGGLAAIGILCMMQAFAEQYDVQTQKDIAQPMIRMGAQALAWGSANEDGGHAVVDEEQNGYMADLYYDEEAGNSWSSARSIQYEFGQAQTGPDTPEYAKFNPEGNFVTRTLNNINDATGGGLDAACSPVGLGLLLVAGVVVAGPISTAISLVVGLASGPAIARFADWIMKTFLAEQVDPLAEGALRGNLMNTGTFLMANEIGLGSGGAFLNDEDHAEVRGEAKEEAIEAFRQKSLAYRLFDTKDPRSFTSRIIDQQSPNPASNLSRTATGLLSVGSSFGSTLASLIPKANAAPPYSYGRNVIAIPPAELENQEDSMENPFMNADIVADILDANAPLSGVDNYVERAKICYGRNIAKVPATTSAGETYEQWTILPQVGDPPTEKTVLDPDNKCREGRGTDHPWARVSLYIKFSDVMNAWGCVRAAPKDTVGHQACADVGNAANSGADE